jgi:hypothetical protein
MESYFYRGNIATSLSTSNIIYCVKESPMLQLRIDQFCEEVPSVPPYHFAFVFSLLETLPNPSINPQESVEEKIMSSQRVLK